MANMELPSFFGARVTDVPPSSPEGSDYTPGLGTRLMVQSASEPSRIPFPFFCLLETTPNAVPQIR